MQTFLPFEDFAETAAVLDMKRAGKQRVETLQVVLGVLRINNDGSPKVTKRTWGDHVIGKLWAPHLDTLLEYQRAICNDWTSRGYKDTCLGKTELALERGRAAGYEDSGVLPPWLGDERLHSSHRAALLFKAPDFYEQYGWTERPEYAYFWPVPQEVVA